MKYIKPHFYDDFKCIAGRCPDTCCANWNIEIDNDSLEKYMSVQNSFGNRLINSVDWENAVFRQYNGQCVLHNDDGLCDLQLEMGADGLCDTCRQYPRHVEEFENLREVSLSLSCPEAVRMLLCCSEKMSFLEYETDEVDDFDDFDTDFFAYLKIARKKIFNILQDRNMSIATRLGIVLDLSVKLQECINNLNEFVLSLEDRKLSVNIASGQTYKYHLMRNQFSFFYEMDIQRGSWEIFLNEVWASLYECSQEDYEQIYQRFVEYCHKGSNGIDFDIIGEQLAVFFIYVYFLGAVYDEDIYAKTAMTVFSVQWIFEFTMAVWVKNNYALTIDDVIKIVYSYARELEHSDFNLDMMEAYTKGVIY